MSNTPSNDQNNQPERVLIPVSPLVYRMTVLESIVNVTPEDYFKAVEIEKKQIEAKQLLSQTDREYANAFQAKGQLILWGMAELRFALNAPAVDEEKEGKKEGATALKNVFDEPEKVVLKKKYIHFAQLFHKHISQLYPKHKSAIENAEPENDPSADSSAG